MLDLGKCTNFGNCEIADTNKIVKLAYTDALTCPECGRPLTLVGKSDQSFLTSRRGMLLGGGALVALLGVGYCTARSPHRGSAGLFGFGGNDVLLTFSGSNMVSTGPGPGLAKAFLESKGYTGVEINMVDGQADNVTGTKDGKTGRIQFNTNDSNTAFKDLRAGTADIGMTSRQIRPEEVRSLAALGAMDSPAAEHVIALIGIAMIVNPANPVTQLSLEQIADIYLGHISNWSQVGGQDAPIHLYAHTIPSGMVDFFREVAMKGGEITSTAKFIKNSTEQSTAVAADPLAIGMVGLPYVLDSRALAISASQSEGVRYVLPNLLTVKSEIYPITARLYLYTPVHSNNPMVGEFVRYATSPDGQAVVATQKFVRYDVERMAGGPKPVTTAANAPDAYKEMTRDADLLQIIYFNTGSRTPEPLAMTLMDTLPNKLDELHLRPSQLMLFGFTDNVGSAAFNMNLSRERVVMITHALDSRGIKVGKGLGFGGTNFLRSNRNDADRRFNRRIEIWASKAS